MAKPRVWAAKIAREGDHRIDAVLVEEIRAEEAAQVAVTENRPRRRDHLRGARPRRRHDRHAATRRLGQQDERGHREHGVERGRREKGPGVRLGPDERKRHEQRDDRPRVADGEAPAGEPAAIARRRQVGQVGIVVDEGALVAHVAEHTEHESPGQHARLDRRHEGRRRHRQRRESDEQGAAHPRPVGDAAEERRGDRDEGHGGRHHPSPPEVAVAVVVAHHGERVVRGVDGGEDDRGKRRVGEVVERPGDDGAPVHAPRSGALESTDAGTRSKSSPSSRMIARRRSARCRWRSRSPRK